MASIMKYLSNPYSIFLPLAVRGFFNSMSDEHYLKLMFRARKGKKLDLKNPRTFNEKIQWLKINDRKPEYAIMVDKYEVKQYVSKKIGEKYIVENYGVWNTFDEIDFSRLPDQFVLKCTHDSGGLVICKNKSELDLANARRKIEHSLKSNFYLWGREWPYKNVKPRIIAEKFMHDKGINSHGLMDYKFYCFNGTPKYLYISQGLDNHKTARISFLTMNWEQAPFGRKDYLSFDILPPKPQNFDEMTYIAKVLSNGHKFLRVDLYEIDGQVYFSELTFSPCSGYMPFAPAEWDRKLGELLILNQ